MKKQNLSKAGSLLVSLFIAVGVVGAAAAFIIAKPSLMPKQASTVEKELSEALNQYCENPELLERALTKAAQEGKKELVRTTEQKRDETKCALGIKKPTTKTTPVPTNKAVQISDDSYNNHYWCDSENTDRCEMCWIDDRDVETCCYKSSAAIAAGNEKCGPGDTKFPPSQKTIVGSDRFTTDIPE